MFDDLEDLIQVEVIGGFQPAILSTPGEWFTIFTKRFELQQ